MTTHDAVSNDVTVVVGLGEMQVTRDDASVLTCLGLGSCICLSCYDPVSKVSGMAHVVLPSSDGRSTKAPAKYADVAVPLLMGEMTRMGALRSRIVAKLTGGAEMSRAAGLDGVFKIGERNLEAVKELLAQEHVRIAAEDTGGNRGRTARMFCGSGKLVVSTAGTESKEL